MDPRLVIDGAAMARLLRSESGPVMRWCIRKGTEVQELAKRQVGVETGRLRDSIVKRVMVVDGQPAVVVTTVGVDYAYWHHEGTEPHVISAPGTGPKAKGAPLLVFFWKNGPNGEGIYAFKSVNHPGTKPNHFLTDPLRQVLGVRAG